MAELVGSALLSAFFNVLFDKLATEEVKNFLRPKKVVNKLLKKLKVNLLSAEELLDDAEEKLIYNQRVEDWHNELKDVVYKAIELGDKIETEALRRKLEGHQSASNITKMFTKLCSNPLSSFDNEVKDELEEILPSLEDLMNQKEALGLVRAGIGRSNYSGVTHAERFRDTPVADESGFCGREDIKETIIRSLLSADVCDDNIAVIPIIGAGGLGKTTLAEIIYNHPDVKLHFPEARAWVTVSTEFDLPAIIKRIIGQVKPSSQIHSNVDRHVLLCELKDALKGKRFLLVLDDVWSQNQDEWDNLKSCFQSGEHGSKIIVTTRIKRVASIAAPNQPLHLLPELPEEDCRRLFAKTVFTGDQDRDAHRDLQEIGKKIVEKCKGLPLSVKSVGGILRRERDSEKWESILKSNVWELLQQNTKNIIPSLWLSYRYLPSEIKPCFAYCSMFPKDFRFEIEEVVRLWMAEGFLKKEAGKRGVTMEEVGKRYVEELISRSLFQRSRDYDDDEEIFIMHDLVHDLAMYVSGKFCFWLDEDKILRGLACETRHFSYNSAIEDVKKFEGLSKAKRLHSFVGLLPFALYMTNRELDILKVLEEVSVEGACLRVLSLSACYKIDSLRDSVGKLKHMRYLNLSYTAVRELPQSVGTLYNLQTLLLSSCKNLSRLPSNLGSLINLHHLDTSYSPLEEMPPKMCNLKKLHTLTDFVLGKQSGSRIRDLGMLENLHGRIRVSGLQNVSNVDDALKANLKNKKNLSGLALEWEDQSDERDSRHEEKVLEALQPPASLKKLIISKYVGVSFPNWDDRDSVFPRLKELQLEGCPKLVGGLPNCNTTTTLRFDKCPKLEFPENQCGYPSLESLYIKESCGSMKSFPLDWFLMLNELELEELECLVELRGESPNLKKLSIKECSKLESLGNCRYGSLKDLKIEKCEALKSIPLDYFPKLNQFELRSCRNFESIRFAEELPLVLESLTRLVLDDLPKFVSFPEGGLPAPNLKDFHIEDCENLRSLPQQMHRLLPSLNNMFVSNCGDIESWPEDGLPSNLESLDIWGCKKLAAQVMHWDLQTLTPCLKSFDIDGRGEELLDSFPPEGLLPTSLTSLDIRNFRGLKTLNIHAFQHLENLHVYDCDELQCLQEESLPNSLKDLYIWRCPLLERRYRKETGEGWHKISHIPQVWINDEEQH